MVRSTSGKSYRVKPRTGGLLRGDPEPDSLRRHVAGVANGTGGVGPEFSGSQLSSHRPSSNGLEPRTNQLNPGGRPAPSRLSSVTTHRASDPPNVPRMGRFPAELGR